VPTARKARQAFLDAADRWDADGAESAVVGLVRAAGAGEIFDLLAALGPCNFGFLDHNAIFVSNAWRTLRCIGWQHAEPVLRSLTRVVFELRPDDLWKVNRELAAKLPAEWQEGKPGAESTTDQLAAMRQDAPAKVSQKVVELLKGGVAPRSIWDAAFAGVGELLMRQPALPNRWSAGVFSLHSVTLLNALHYAYSTAGSDETRRLLLLQGAAIVPRFLSTMKERGGAVGNARIDRMEPAALKAPAGEAAGEVFAEVGTDRTLAARKAFTLLKDAGPRELIDAAQRVVFLKGTDTHDYKFSAAVFEDYHHVSPAWRDRYLATAMFITCGSADRDNPLVNRVRETLKA
jgi:hypothetical protein